MTFENLINSYVFQKLSIPKFCGKEQILLNSSKSTPYPKVGR